MLGPMAELVYEIWEDGGAQEMERVSLVGDWRRRATRPGAALVHSFTAASYGEALAAFCAWNGNDKWQPAPGFEDHVFTDAEEAEQRAYLAVRAERWRGR